MKVRNFVVLVGLMMLVAFSSEAQYGGDYTYSRESVWGITKATNSGLIGGLMFKHTRSLGNNWFHGIGIEIVNIKHPQEQKYFTQTSNTFIWGKENYLYSIRLSYDREYVLFRKAPQQGVQINAIFMGGPTIGLEAPYYVEIKGPANTTVRVPYDAEKMNGKPDQILGTGGILQGIGQSSVVPGLNLKSSVAFEFGTFKSNVVGVEVGFQVDFFVREINIIPTANNQSIFPSAFFTLFYGGRK